MREEQLVGCSDDQKAGDVFQRICYDILSRCSGEPRLEGVRLTPFKTGGQDGAIDHWGVDEQNNRVICECKKNNSLENAESALSKLKGTLKQNLPLPAGAATEVAKRYNSWRSPKFKTYIYCTSFSPDPPEQQNTFLEKLEKMFRELAGLEGLSHLAEVAVCLFTWNDLYKKLEADPFLYHRWIKSTLPSGVQVLEKPVAGKEKKRQYRDYLSSAQVYISRDDYKRSRLEREGAKPLQLVTEREILKNLLHDEGCDGCIIHGEGGIGKTRLMLELAFRAREIGWTALMIGKNLDGLESLEPVLSPGSRYLLVFDYIEEHAHFDTEVAEKLAAISPDAEIKILGNCRNSHFVSAHLDEVENFFLVDIGLERQEGEKAYSAFVTSQILGTELSRFFKVEEGFYALRPAFAVFLRFLHEKHEVKNKKEKKNKTQFENLDLREAPSFRKWMRKRLEWSLQAIEDGREKRVEIYNLFPCFPWVGEKKLRDDFNDYLTPLLDDGWLEEDAGNGVRVIHDTIADEILMFRLEKYAGNQRSLEVAMKEVFNFAIAHGCVENCYRAFERIVDWEAFKKYNGIFRDFLSGLIKDHGEACGDVSKFAITPLMEEREIISLLAERIAFFRSYIEDRGFAAKLGFKMRYFAKKETPTEETLAGIKQLLAKWLAANGDFLSWKTISTSLLHSYMTLFGLKGFPEGDEEGLKEKVADCVKRYPREMDTSFLFKAWLDAGGEKNIIEKYIEPWIQAFPTALDTSFVFKAWLDAGGKKNIIEKYIEPWIQAFPKEIETHFVFKAWLDAGGKKNIIEKYIEPWIQAFPTALDTSFVFQAWLDAGGEKNIIEKYIEPWIKKFPTAFEARFVFQAWLDAGGEKNIIEKYIEPWIQAFPTALDTSFVFKAWLDAGGEKNIIEKYIEPWIQAFPTALDTSFVFQAWLDAGGEKNIIEKYIEPWIQAFPKEIETHFVFKAWLDAGGEKNIIEKYIEPWIQAFPTAMETSFLFKAWLDAGGKKTSLRNTSNHGYKHSRLPWTQVLYFKHGSMQAGKKTSLRNTSNHGLKNSRLRLKHVLYFKHGSMQAGKKTSLRNTSNHGLKNSRLRLKHVLYFKHGSMQAGKKTSLRNTSNHGYKHSPIN